MGELVLYGCNPLIDPLWFDERFRAALHAVSFEPCPLAKPWPVVRLPLR